MPKTIKTIKVTERVDEFGVKRIKLRPQGVNFGTQTTKTNLDNAEDSLLNFECSFAGFGNVSTQISMTKSKISRNKCKYCCKKVEKPVENVRESFDGIPPLILLPTAVPPLVFRSDNPKTYKRKISAGSAVKPQSDCNIQGNTKSEDSRLKSKITEKVESEKQKTERFLNNIREKLQEKLDEAEMTKPKPNPKPKERDKRLVFPKQDNPKTYLKSAKVNEVNENTKKKSETVANILNFNFKPIGGENQKKSENIILLPEFVDCVIKEEPKEIQQETNPIEIPEPEFVDCNVPIVKEEREQSNNTKKMAQKNFNVNSNIQNYKIKKKNPENSFGKQQEEDIVIVKTEIKMEQQEENDN